MLFPGGLAFRMPRLNNRDMKSAKPTRPSSRLPRWYRGADIPRRLITRTRTFHDAIQ
jgi:hypothetical protein